MACSAIKFFHGRALLRIGRLKYSARNLACWLRFSGSENAALVQQIRDRVSSRLQILFGLMSSNNRTIGYFHKC